MSDSTGGMTGLDDIDDMEMIMQQLRYEQSLQEQEAESSNRRNYFYRQRDVAEEQGAHKNLNSPMGMETDVKRRMLHEFGVCGYHGWMLFDLIDEPAA
ncbi:hypothetical protein Tco_0916774 [Tanacetum coccineum]